MRFSLLTLVATGLSSLALANELSHAQARAPIVPRASTPAKASAAPTTSGAGAKATTGAATNGTVQVTVVQGDTLTKIAQQFSSGICDIAKLNNIKDPNFLAIGQVLQVPTNLTNPDNTSCLAAATPVAGNGTVAHTVVAGDTLTTLAQKFNTGICNIAKASGIADADINKLEVGQVLQIPQNATPDNTSCVPASSSATAEVPVKTAVAKAVKVEAARARRELGIRLAREDSD